MSWQSKITPDTPCWNDYLSPLAQLDGTEFPTCEQLNKLLPGQTKSRAGHPVRFVAESDLDDTPYEQQIYDSGRVSTRANHWHDLFNALVWLRFPHIKIAMNALHQQALSTADDGQRGPVRDALTLFDECGVIVFSARTDLLEQLAQHRWQAVFLHNKRCWAHDISLTVSGHAMLEKFLSPYKSMTAKALLVSIGKQQMALPRETWLRLLDKMLAERIASGSLLQQPAVLTPLPMAGVPGWWSDDKQDADFYLDRRVFRHAPRNSRPAAITSLA